jgi:dTDP-4-amino-4,6-dideoxy-D-glucose acyltransferase
MKQLGGYFLSREELLAAGFKRIGENVKIHSKASLYGLENMEIGDNVRIDDFSVIIATGPLVIGNHVSIPNFCFLGAKNGISIGNYVTFAPSVKIFSASDDYSGERLTGVMVPPEMTGGDHGPVEIEDHVLIGCGSIVLPGCRIAKGCSIGALSLVKTNLDAWGIYAGIPATRKKDRKQELIHYEKKVKECLNPI